MHLNILYLFNVCLIFYNRIVSIDVLDANINDPNNQLAVKQQIKV